MCLGIPGKILKIDGMVALVDFFGVERKVRLDVVDEPVECGDYVLNHVGYAIKRIPDEEIDATLTLYEELLKQVVADDFMAADVRQELAATAGEDDG